MGPITAGMLSIKTTCTSHELNLSWPIAKHKSLQRNMTHLLFDNKAEKLESTTNKLLNNNSVSKLTTISTVSKALFNAPQNCWFFVNYLHDHYWTAPIFKHAWIRESSSLLPWSQPHHLAFYVREREHTALSTDTLSSQRSLRFTELQNSLQAV